MNWSKIFLIISGLSLVTALTGCSSVTHAKWVQQAGLFPDRENQYLQGRTLPPLKTPPGQTTIPNDPYYAVPDSTGPTPSSIPLLPPGSVAAKKANFNPAPVTPIDNPTADTDSIPNFAGDPLNAIHASPTTSDAS